MMRPYLIVFFVCLLFVNGCEEKFIGRYEANLSIFGNPAVFKHLQTKDPMFEIMKVAHEMNRWTLDFDGSKVRMENIGVVYEYPYTVKGKDIEVFSKVMGQKVIIPMKIEADGSVSYMGIRFHKVR